MTSGVSLCSVAALGCNGTEPASQAGVRDGTSLAGRGEPAEIRAPGDQLAASSPGVVARTGTSEWEAQRLADVLPSGSSEQEEEEGLQGPVEMKFARSSPEDESKGSQAPPLPRCSIWFDEIADNVKQTYKS